MRRSFLEPKSVENQSAMWVNIRGVEDRGIETIRLNLYIELVRKACSDVSSLELKLAMLVNPAEARIIATVKL